MIKPDIDVGAAITLTDPLLINLYRLRVIKIGLKLEKQGLHRSKGLSCYSLAIKEMPGIEVAMQVRIPGRKGPDRIQYVMDRLDEHINRLEAEAGIKR